jgi:hypothetical protein
LLFSIRFFADLSIFFLSLIKRQKKDDRYIPLFNSRFLGVTNFVAAVLQAKHTNIYFSILQLIKLFKIMENLNMQHYGSVMPLLMNYTPSTRIEESDASQLLSYDYLKQIVPIEMRMVGTKSLKVSSTKKGVGTVQDRKNEIDDSKQA